MKRFYCHCGAEVFFENVYCGACNARLGFDSVDLQLYSLYSTGNFTWQSKQGNYYRFCSNAEEFSNCNWLVPAEDNHDRCVACRLNRTIPDLSRPGNLENWHELERSKRRLVYTLLGLGLPVISRWDQPDCGLLFDFLEGGNGDSESFEGYVTTGHSSGVITINVSEADPAKRENTRRMMNEAYRTLLGHFRHESGHYYWSRLFSDETQLIKFRSVFGDEKKSYTQALENYYQAGPPDDWSDQYISAYAASHPLEDWAETWAHYLHMTETLETARSWGITECQESNFDLWINEWISLTIILNQMNRSMGQQDAYPFVVSGPVRRKLHFISEVIKHYQNNQDPVAAIR